MNKLYPLAALLSAILLFNGAQAQTYTAVRNGDWHAKPAQTPVWDLSGEPPSNCIGCNITINSGVSVTLNTHIVLSGGSTLRVGSDGTAAALLLIPSSTGLDWESSYNIILNSGVPLNDVKLNDPSGLINTGSAGRHDGVLINHNTSYYKQMGNAPNNFEDTLATTFGPAQFGTSLVGPRTLSSNGTLPITMTGFDAVVNNSDVDLIWTTQFEQNSDHFDIERSSNGGAKWDVAGKVSAAGYSTKPLNYSFTDVDPGSGVFQYRIHGYDLDGRPTYTSIKLVRTSQLASISVFPNPAKDYVNVSLPVSEATAGMVSVRLIGQTGQLLVEKRVTGAGGTTLSIPVSNYAPGNYLLQVVTADGSKQISKVLISRQ